MIGAKKARLLAIIFSTTLLFCFCSKEKKDQKPGLETKEEEPGKKVYEPETYPFPENLKEVLPGLQGDKIYIYREISPTVNLVAYFKDYSLDNAILATANAFTVLIQNPELKKNIDFWIIQVQPEAETEEVLVWGVRPSQAETYAQTKDLKSFLRDSEYLLVNDEIIPAGDERLKFLPNSQGK